MTSSAAARFRVRPNVPTAARRRRAQKQEGESHAAASADTCIDALTAVSHQPVNKKNVDVAGSFRCACAELVADSQPADPSLGSVCRDCGAIGGRSGSSESLLVHTTHDSNGAGACAAGQWTSRALGARGLGATAQLASDSSGAVNRAISARRCVQQRVGHLLTQLRLSLTPLRAAALSLVDAAVGGRYGNGSSRWLELVCIACVYVAHRQQQTHTVAKGERQVLLTSELAALVGMEERLVLAMAGRIHRRHVRPHTATVPLTGVEYLPHLIATVKWRDGGSTSELLNRQRTVHHKASQLLRIAHKLDLQHGQSINAPRQLSTLSLSVVADRIPWKLCCVVLEY